jgi:hypothetical protein
VGAQDRVLIQDNLKQLTLNEKTFTMHYKLILNRIIIMQDSLEQALAQKATKKPNRSHSEGPGSPIKYQVSPRPRSGSLSSISLPPGIGAQRLADTEAIQMNAKKLLEKNPFSSAASTSLELEAALRQFRQETKEKTEAIQVKAEENAKKLLEQNPFSSAVSNPSELEAALRQFRQETKEKTEAIQVKAEENAKKSLALDPLASEEKNPIPSELQRAVMLFRKEQESQDSLRKPIVRNPNATDALETLMKGMEATQHKIF